MFEEIKFWSKFIITKINNSNSINPVFSVSERGKSPINPVLIMIHCDHFFFETQKYFNWFPNKVDFGYEDLIILPELNQIL